MKIKALAELDHLISEADSILSSSTPHDFGDFVDDEALATLKVKVAAFLGAVGPSAHQLIRPDWLDRVTSNASDVRKLRGRVRGLRQAIDRGLLASIEARVLDEAHGDLLEQAQNLLDKGYNVAGAVVCRVVLEHHLRTWCDALGCMPTTPRPGLNDFNQALYAHELQGKHLRKTAMMAVTAMAAVGNEAAHGKSVSGADAKKLLADVQDFLARNPLPA